MNIGMIYQLIFMSIPRLILIGCIFIDRNVSVKNSTSIHMRISIQVEIRINI